MYATACHSFNFTCTLLRLLLYSLGRDVYLFQFTFCFSRFQTFLVEKLAHLNILLYATFHKNVHNPSLNYLCFVISGVSKTSAETYKIKTMKGELSIFMISLKLQHVLLPSKTQKNQI